MTRKSSPVGALSDVDFGDVAGSVSEMLQEAVSLYRHDRTAGEKMFRQAMLVDELALAPYLCLTKILTYQGRLDEALAVTRAGLALAAEQAGLDPELATWRAEDLPETFEGPVRFALYMVKALAFIHLKRGEAEVAQGLIAKLADLDRLESVGGGVISDLAKGVG